jgi:predicted nucleic acid-binding protein
MILLDTSIMIAQLCAADIRLLSLFKRHRGAVCGVTRAEVLYGVRSPADKVRFLNALDALPQTAIPETLWDEVGLNLAHLRTNGRPMPITDVVVASLAMYLDVELWARDQHFPAMQLLLPRLRLFPEPP